MTIHHHSLAAAMLVAAVTGLTGCASASNRGASAAPYQAEGLTPRAAVSPPTGDDVLARRIDRPRPDRERTEVHGERPWARREPPFMASPVLQAIRECWRCSER